MPGTRQNLAALLSTSLWHARLARTADPAAATAGLHRIWAAAPERVRTAVLADAALAQALLILLAESDFLTETLVQEPEWLLWLQQENHRTSARAREDWAAELAAMASGATPEQRPRVLIQFRRREMLRIAWRDLAGLAPLAETTQDLSLLADAAIHQSYVWAWNDAVSRWGVPQSPEGVAEFAVLGLGKLGGEELNYASDIDLLFLYSNTGQTAGGPQTTANHDFFTRLAQAMVRLLSASAAGGPAYRVDLRLRPGGREGELALAVAPALAYYRAQARPWELQTLIRARPCAGSLRMGEQWLAELAPAIYPARPDVTGLAETVLASRRMMQAQLSRHRASGRQAESINVKLDPGGIRDVEFLAQYLQRLHGGADTWVRSGNTLIGLQRLHDKRLLPSHALQSLTSSYTLLRHLEHRLQLRLGQQTHTLPLQPQRVAALARSLSRPALLHDLTAAMAGVHATYRSFLSPAPVPAPLPSQPRPGNASDSIALSPALDNSTWMSAALIRRPALAAVFAFTEAPPLPADLTEHPLPSAMAALRRWHQAGTFWELAHEWDTARPVAVSLQRLSELAIVALQAAVTLALPGTAPTFAVLALGRLGLGELDLLSDLDLVFVAHESEREAASRRAAALIHILSAYTQEGPLFTVDTRLRPGGGEGELVQTPASLARYFRERAGWWEAVSYLKARPMGGDAAVGKAAVAEVHAALREHVAPEPDDLRQRMEAAGRPGHWGLKTPPGGIYDADFLIARRWLAEPSTMPPPLAGQPLAAWAQAMGMNELADLVTRLRAADHALRVGAGKAGSAMPAAGAPIERAWRWLEHVAGVPVAGAPAFVFGTRARIRELYHQ